MDNHRGVKEAPLSLPTILGKILSWSLSITGTIKEFMFYQYNHVGNCVHYDHSCWDENQMIQPANWTFMGRFESDEDAITSRGLPRPKMCENCLKRANTLRSIHYNRYRMVEAA